MPDSNDQHGPESSQTTPPPAGPASGFRSKGRETELRHKEERRVEKLRDIRAQIASGTLVVRQMTLEERCGDRQTSEL